MLQYPAQRQDRQSNSRAPCRTPSHTVPASSNVFSLDRVAVDQYVLVIIDSLFDRDAEDVAHHQGVDFPLDPAVSRLGVQTCYTSTGLT